MAEWADFYLTAKADYTGVEMTRSSGQPRQTWNWNGERLKFLDKAGGFCLSSTGTANPDGDNQYKDGQPPNVTIGPCTQGLDPNVQVITWRGTMEQTEFQLKEPLN